MSIIFTIAIAIILTFLLTAFKDNKKSKITRTELDSEFDTINIKQAKPVYHEKKQILVDADLILEITALHKQQQFSECIEACNKFLLNEQNNSSVLLIKAESLSLYGKKNMNVKYLKDAIDILEKLEQKESNHAEILFVLGDTWIRLAFAYGKTQSDENKIIECANISSKYYYKAHQIDLNNESILAELAFAKYIAGYEDDAIFYINKAKTINKYNKRVIEIYDKLNSI